MREKINIEEPNDGKAEDKMSIQKIRETEINAPHNINIVNEMTEHKNNSSHVKESKSMDINEIISQAKITQNGSEFLCLIDKLFNVIKEKDALINRLSLTTKSPN